MTPTKSPALDAGLLVAPQSEGLFLGLNFVAAKVFLGLSEDYVFA